MKNNGQTIARQKTLLNPLPSSDEDVFVLFASLGELLDLEDLEAVELFLETLLAEAELEVVVASEVLADSCLSNSSSTRCLNCQLLPCVDAEESSNIEGTGEFELVGVWVREALREDLRVKGLWSMRCFHSKRRFMDSSRWNN